MGTTTNARSDTYGQARKHSDMTIYVFSDTDIPTPSAGEIALNTEVIYQIDKLLELTDTLVCTDNAIRGIGSVNNRIEWSGTVTAFKQEGDYQLTINDMFLQQPDGDTCTLLDVTNANSSPGAAVIMQNGNVLRFWSSLGMVTQTRVNITDTDVINIEGGISFRNCPQVVMELLFWGFREPTQPPPDWLIHVYDDDTLSGQITRDVNLQNMRTNAQKTTNTDCAFFYIDPLINPNANILIAGCSIIGGSNPADAFVQGDEGEITAYSDNGDGTITCTTSATGSLANDDHINILRTENYNGGYAVSNVVADTSFDITATYVDNPGRGTWHTGSIDYRDPRIKSRDNINIQMSRSTMAMYQNDNTAVTTLGTQDDWEIVQFDNLVDGPPLVERFAMCGDGTVAEFIYHGREMLTGTINVQMRCECDSGGNSLDDFEFGWGLNGAEPANLFRFQRPNVSATINQEFIFNQGYMVETGDKLTLWVKCVTDARDLIVTDFAAFTNEI